MTDIDMKVLSSVLSQLEEERGISREKALGAIEEAFAHAYKKEYGKRNQIVRAEFDPESGDVEFEQIKIVVDESSVRFKEAEDDEQSDKSEVPTSKSDGTREDEPEEKLPFFDPEKHIMLDDAQKIKKGVKLDEEITFPLETKEDFGRIAAQTAKQVLIQNIREAEKEHLSEEYGKKEGEIISGSVQRIERGNIFIDLGHATGFLPYDEQIPGERYRQGERIRAYLFRVEETARGVFLKLSRSHPAFIEKLFEFESPEVANGTVEIRAIAREPGSRSKIAVWSNDDNVDPVGALVGQRGVRVSTVMSELGGEKIDIIEWSDEAEEFIEDALSPAKVHKVEIENEEQQYATARVTEDQQSLAIGRGGQNVRLAAKLTGWRIDIQSIEGETVAEADEDGEVEIKEEIEENSEDKGGNKEKEEKADTDEGSKEIETDEKELSNESSIESSKEEQDDDKSSENQGDSSEGELEKEETDEQNEGSDEDTKKEEESS